MKCIYCGCENSEDADFCTSCGKRIEIKKERFCPNCGSHVDENVMFCEGCGTKLDNQKSGMAASNDVQSVNKPSSENNITVKNKKHKKGKLGCAMVIGLFVIVVLFIALCTTDSGNTSKEELVEAIQKLQKFTDLQRGEDRYSFKYKDESSLYSFEGWSLTYQEKNEFVTFEEDVVIDCFTECFGADCFSDGSASSGGFAYDLDENAARIFFDHEVAEGKLTTINYDIDKNEFTVMIGGERYSASDELIDYINDYGLVDIWKLDVEQFKDQLEDNGLTFMQIKKIKYDDIFSLYPDSKVETNDDVVSSEIDDNVITETLDEMEIDKIGTSVEYGNIIVTLNQVKSFVSRECADSYHSHAGKEMLYIGYTVQNIGDTNKLLWGRQLFVDGKSYSDFATLCKEDAEAYNLNEEDGADELRPNAMDEYYFIAYMDIDEYSVIEFELYNGLVLVLKNGEQSCIEVLDNVTPSQDTKNSNDQSDGNENESLTTESFDEEWYKNGVTFYNYEEGLTLTFGWLDDGTIIVSINDVVCTEFDDSDYTIDGQMVIYDNYDINTNSGTQLQYTPGDPDKVFLVGYGEFIAQ